MKNEILNTNLKKLKEIITKEIGGKFILSAINDDSNYEFQTVIGKDMELPVTIYMLESIKNSIFRITGSVEEEKQ